MMSSNLQYSSTQEEQLQCCLPATVSDFGASSAADELCDEMMLHVFTCSTCLDESEDACSVYQSLKAKMTQIGGPVHGRFLAI